MRIMLYFIYTTALLLGIGGSVAYAGNAEQTTDTARVPLQVVAQTGHQELYSARFSVDDQRLYTYTKNGEIHGWDVASLKQVRTYVGHTGEVKHFQVFEKGVASCNDNAVFIWYEDGVEEQREVPLFDSTGEYEIRFYKALAYNRQFLLVTQGIDVPDSATDYTVTWKVDLLTGAKHRMAPALLDGTPRAHPDRPLLANMHYDYTTKDTLYFVLQERRDLAWDTLWKARAATLPLSRYHSPEPFLTPDGSYVYFKNNDDLSWNQSYSEQGDTLHAYRFFRIDGGQNELASWKIYYLLDEGGAVQAYTDKWQQLRFHGGRIDVLPQPAATLDSAYHLYESVRNYNEYLETKHKSEQYPQVLNHGLSMYAATGANHLSLYGAEGRLLRTAEFKVARPQKVHVSKDGKRFLIQSGGDEKVPPRVWEWGLGEAFPKGVYVVGADMPKEVHEQYAVPVSDSVVSGSRYRVKISKTFATTYYRGVQTITLTDTSGKEIVLAGHLDEATVWAFNREETLLVSASQGKGNKASFNDIKVWNIEKGIEWKRMLDVDPKTKPGQHFRSSVAQFAFTGNSQYLWGSYPDLLVKWEVATGLPVSDLAGFAPFALSNGDSLMAATAGQGQEVVVYHTGTGKQIWKLANHNSAITDVQFVNDNRYLLTASKDGKTKLWDLSNGQEVFNIIQFKDGESYSILTPEHYYLGSRESINELNFVVDNKAYSYEQFDLALNRPDLVLKQVQTSTDSRLIEALEQAWKKRAKRTGMNEAEAARLPQIESLPRTEIKSSYEAQGHLLMDLSFQAIGSDQWVQGYQVKVNGIPLYPDKGRLFETRGRRLMVRDTIVLTTGKNYVQVYCFDDGGKESLRQEVIAENAQDDARPKRIFIGIGVSQYSDTKFNLVYPAKDVEDLSKTFDPEEEEADWEERRVNKKQYKSILLKNSQATRQNILALKKELMQTGVDDEVILSFNGHGLIDSTLNFYFATYDVNYTNPSAKGLSYSDIAGLLDGIPARKRLVLMDACHSGPLDTDNAYEQVIDSMAGEGQRGTILLKNPKKDEQTLQLGNTFRLMQNLFTEITESNGAIIIAAAGGDEYAFENNTWKNGVFTFSIRKALEEDRADADKDGAVTVTEVKRYVAQQVETLTNGLQQPTARQDNPKISWTLK